MKLIWGGPQNLYWTLSNGDTVTFVPGVEADVDDKEGQRVVDAHPGIFTVNGKAPDAPKAKPAVPVKPAAPKPELPKLG